MDPHTAELVTVVSHSEDGRILQYIKNLIPVTEADQMKAAARLRAEEKKAAALVRDTEALVEKAHAPAPTSDRKPTAPAARPAPVPQQRAAPRAAPIASPDDVVPVRDVLAPARGATKRKPQGKPDLVAEIRKLPEAERKAFLAKATKLLSNYTIADGKGFGQAAMKILIDRTPPGHKASNVDRSLESMVRFGIKRLQDNKQYPLAQWPEWPALFERGFWAGCNEAVAEYNDKPKQPAPTPQQADAGDTQHDKQLCQTEQ
jgi:hypothetical protein